MRRARAHRHSGFTLLELLVSVSIIALLAAILQFRVWRRRRLAKIMDDVNFRGTEFVSLRGASREQDAGSEPTAPGEDTASSPRTGR